MTAKLKLDSGVIKPARREKRRINRFAANSRVLVRSSHGDSCKAELSDVSVFGCSLQSTAEWLRIGMFVSINLTSDWSVQAVVRWARSGSAGVEFLRPISEADAREISND
jgi:PilZ domain